MSGTIQSLVNSYEVALLEANKSGSKPCPAGILKCFQTWDEIIPWLGQYRKVMKLLRDDIYDAVFSREYTVSFIENDADITNEERQNTRKVTSVDRVPHFVLLDKIVSERNERADDAEKESARLKSVVEQLEEHIRELVVGNNNLNESIDSKNNEIQNLMSNLHENELENTRLVLRLEKQEENFGFTLGNLEAENKRLKADLVREQKNVEYLSGFKKCHDDLQEHFRELPELARNSQSGLFSAKEQKIRKDLKEGKTIEKQLLQLRNTCIDEFDQFLEKQNSAEKNLMSSENNQKGGNEHEDINILDSEKRREYEDRFVKMIDQIENEFEQNKQHLAVFKAELDELNRSKRESRPKESTKSKLQSTDDESHLLEMVKDSSSNYQFLPQEPNLNKYAIIAMYSCNQGESFYEFQQVQHCRSCGQKTLVCPHKVTKGERVFHLPLQATHVKFMRPGLNPPEAVVKQEISEEKHPMSPVSVDLERPSDNYSRFWEDLRTRGQPSVTWVPRVIHEDLLVSLIRQFYDWILWGDLSDDDETLAAMLNLWYVFLYDRYQARTVAISTALDIAEAIRSVIQTNKFVQLFVECLCGNLDPAVFRYYLTLCRLIKSVKWKSNEDFGCFAKIIYAFMNSEDLEQFTMAYVSFSENRISEVLISKFFLYIILKQREPCFLDMEHKLLQYGTNTTHMTDVVFFEALADILPLSSELLSQRLFAQSIADSKTNYVSISRLSHIAAFLQLHQRTTVLEIQINEKLQNDG